MLNKYQIVNRAKTFNTFKPNLCLWKVELEDSISTTMCDCPSFHLFGYCKHVLVALVKSKKILLPNIYSQKTVLQENKKRGRRKKATYALNRE